MSTEIASIRKRNTAILAGIVVFGMLGAAYASVPLYRLFCQLTGYAGTTQVAEAAVCLVVCLFVKFVCQTSK